ncbi:helix-turn-helix domain-containing protein [Cohnella nanjingensis]|uniref:Helix-turn-helix transcriptional regulator n=1 Tax=Cohnella nanjingensis TaxID=1387779 RepID=A0A7X0RTX7_9BACL|nr:AraC family transcriptional regulator [Cohnella nanjingensis]MBB6673653.1 helix-turn-helix transcriptional regulator [Cohnella nanjingensis]
MSNLAIRRLSPSPVLKEYIKDIWVFESSGRLGKAEMQTIAPNGAVKLLLHYEGHLVGRIGEHASLMAKHQLFVAGVSDCPTIADFDRGKPFGCISIELNPAAAYRLLAVPQHELRNTIVTFGELIGTPAARILEERMYLASNPEDKAVLLQEYLIWALNRTERDETFEHVAAAIMNARGLISMAALSHETGRSDRWLRAKFAERLGIGPKAFSSIVRFQSCFQALLRDKSGFLQSRHFNDHYYDQAHFIKEFKRFIGYSPTRYTALQNDVGEIIYR